jgi:hypothetical protein
MEKIINITMLIDLRIMQQHISTFDSAGARLFRDNFCYEICYANCREKVVLFATLIAVY